MLHYGKEYLEYALEPLLKYCDDVIVLYSQAPSFGFTTELKCPDSRADLMDIACKLGVEWHDIQFGAENEHRGMLETYARDHRYDVLVTADSDEIWKDGLGVVLAHLEHGGNGPIFTAKRWTVNMVTPWQTFDQCCKDGFEPVRIHDLRPNRDREQISSGSSVYHFGYAISDELMAYKWAIHGHRDELRPDWMKNKWLAKATQDVHPVAIGLWNAEPIDRQILPANMRRHPRWS